MQNPFSVFLEKKILNKITSIQYYLLIPCLLISSFSTQAQTGVDSYIASLNKELKDLKPVNDDFDQLVAGFIDAGESALLEVGYKSYTENKHDSIVLAIAGRYRTEAERRYDSELYTKALILYKDIYHRDINEDENMDLDFRQLLIIQSLWGIAQSFQDQGEFFQSTDYTIRAMQAYHLHGSNNLFDQLLKHGAISSPYQETVSELLFTYEEQLLRLAQWYEDMSMYQKTNTLLTEHENLINHPFFKHHSPQQCFVSKIYRAQFLYNTNRHQASLFLYKELKATFKLDCNQIPKKYLIRYLKCISNHGDVDYGLELIKKIKKKQDSYIFKATTDFNEQVNWIYIQLIYSDLLCKKARYKKAKNVLRKSQTIDLGLHPLTLDIYHAFAHIYKYENQLDSVQYFYHQALKYCTDSYEDQGQDYIHYVKVWKSLAEFYHKKGDYDQAIFYYKSIEKNCEHKLIQYHDKNVAVYKALGQLYLQRKRYKEASRYYSKLKHITEIQIQNNYPYLNEEYQKIFWEQKQIYFDLYLSYCVDYNKKQAEDIANWWLDLKELMLQRSRMINAKRYELIDPVWMQKFMELDSLRAQYIGLYWADDSEYKKRIEVKINKIESELSTIFYQQHSPTDPRKTTWQHIRKQLEEDKSIAIDILHFNYYKNGIATDSVRYIALISLPEEKDPILVPLCWEKDLIEKLKYSTDGDGSYLSTPADNKFLYDKLWLPLRSYLGNYKKIYLSLSGYTQCIAFDALHDYKQSKDLIDLYQISHFGNLKTIINFSEDSNKDDFKTIALFGGCIYSTLLNNNNVADSELEAQGELLNHSIEPSYTDSDQGNSSNRGETQSEGNQNLPGFWADLMHTEHEVKKIQNLLSTQQDWLVQPFLGSIASEASLKRLNGRGSPQILHIATHGFSVAPFQEGDYLPVGMRKKIILAEEPFWRCGLILSGANNAWKSSQTIINHENDGVLFAYEIATLSLSNTELVVLNACQTANGDLSANTESLQGLQRAFRQAGAKKVLMTLSYINDKKSAEMMTLFYKHYLKTSSYNEAFLKARKEFRRNNPDPKLWAPFILIN
ncbi:MAG: CHAT domain-containing protein [Saprospiraceae bacterium]|nr:CHAT domain-containing protein [Saprospiraceae bacterium]